MGEYAGSSLVQLEQYSALQRERLSYVPVVPAALADPAFASVATGEATVAATPAEEAATGAWFPHLYGKPVVSLVRSSAPVTGPKCSAVRIGVVFCGRQTPGVHNVVAGIADHLYAMNPSSVVVGFEGGTKGLFEGKALEVTQDLLALVRNQGGMNLLGRSADRIRTPAELAAALATCDAQRLDGLVLVGGECRHGDVFSMVRAAHPSVVYHRSCLSSCKLSVLCHVMLRAAGCLTATDAAHLSEYFAARQSGAVRTHIVAVPATIDGDLRNQFVETTVGHDTATKTYAQLAGNIATDASSAKKYWWVADHKACVTSRPQPRFADACDLVVFGGDEAIEHRPMASVSPVAAFPPHARISCSVLLQVLLPADGPPHGARGPGNRATDAPQCRPSG